MKRLAHIALVLVLTVCTHAAIQRDPADLLNSSREAFEKRDYDKAAKLLTDAIEGNPKLTPAYILRGLAYAAKDRLDDALADFSKAITLTPTDERPFMLRAAVYQQKKDYDKAIADYTQALNRRPDDASLLLDRGVCYAAEEKEDKALADFERAVQSEPKNARAWQLRGSLQSQMGNKEKALADFKEAIAIDANDPVTYLFRSQHYLVDNQPEKGLADLEEVMRRAPNYSGAANDYAWTLATNPKDSIRNGHRAVEYAKKACHGTDYKYAPSLDTLAAAHAEAGEWDDAVKWQTEAATLAEKTHPDDVKGMKERLALFKEKKAFREIPKREKKEKK
jgi:tetratricopeptide (TPR) repeat protein